MNMILIWGGGAWNREVRWLPTASECPFTTLSLWESQPDASIRLQWVSDSSYAALWHRTAELFPTKCDVLRETLASTFEKTYFFWNLKLEWCLCRKKPLDTGDGLDIRASWYIELGWIPFGLEIGVFFFFFLIPWSSSVCEKHRFVFLGHPFYYFYFFLHEQPSCLLACPPHPFPSWPRHAQCAGNPGNAPAERARLTRSAAAHAGPGPPRPPCDSPAPRDRLVGFFVRDACAERYLRACRPTPDFLEPPKDL